MSWKLCKDTFSCLFQTEMAEEKRALTFLQILHIFAKTVLTVPYSFFCGYPSRSITSATYCLIPGKCPSNILFYHFKRLALHTHLAIQPKWFLKSRNHTRWKIHRWKTLTDSSGRRALPALSVAALQAIGNMLCLLSDHNSCSFFGKVCFTWKWKKNVAERTGWGEEELDKIDSM